MQVLTRVGHAVQEDDPEKVASILANFLVRNKFTSPTGEFVRYVKIFFLQSMQYKFYSYILFDLIIIRLSISTEIVWL